MYLKYPQENIIYRDDELRNPLEYLDIVQERLNLSCLKIKNVPFQKKSRVCRNIIIENMVELVHKYNIRGYFWGLTATRPVYYIYPLLSQLEGFYNFDYCKKEEFDVLNKQSKQLRKIFPTVDIKSFNRDIFDAINNAPFSLKPSIVELDGMKTLSDEQCKKVLDFVKELPKENRCLLAITSTIGRVPGFSQEFYEKRRGELVNDINSLRNIITHKSIEYAEQTKENGPHYPMRTEIFVL